MRAFFYWALTPWVLRALLPACLRRQRSPRRLHSQPQFPVTWRNEWFRDRGYFDPLIAEPRAPQIAFTFPAWIPELQFSVEPGTRLAWEVSLGREIPIFSRANFDDATRRKGSQGFGLWVDVSFHMIEDMGKDPSNPIINTDYRFSLGKLKYYRIMSTPTLNKSAVRHWKSMALRGDLYHHESTHLGDEFVVNGQGAHPGEFERQNVSFEFYDITGRVQLGEQRRVAALDSRRHDRARQAFARLLLGSHADVSARARCREIRAQLRAVHAVPVPRAAPHQACRSLPPGGTAQPGGLASSAGEFEQPARWAPFVSADLRRRIVLDFNKASADVKEETQWSVNMLGRHSLAGWQFARFAIKEIYARYYHGVNPHGQLRNQKDFWLAGFGVNFSVGDR